MLDRSATLPRPVEISIKPTQLGLDIDRAACLRHLESLAARCEEIGTWLWLDMEGSAYVEPTLALYEQLKADHQDGRHRASRPTCTGRRPTCVGSCRSNRRSAS